MFQSIIDDIKQSFRSGNMVTRLIILNIGIFVVTALTEAFAPSFYSDYILPWIAVPSEPLKLLTRPWTLFTHMYIHSGLSHVIWNMLYLYWFGRIVGDLIGDRHILPIYIVAGLFGAFTFIIASVLFPDYYSGRMVGASAAIMGIVLIAGMINPDKMLHLIFFSVKIKFVVAALIFLDLLFIGRQQNTGGHIAHLGGMVMGYIYLYNLGSGKDWSHKINGWVDSILNVFKREQRPRKTNLKVEYKSEKIKTKKGKVITKTSSNREQLEVDAILDKINKKGMKSLTQEEKDILYQASKKDK